MTTPINYDLEKHLLKGCQILQIDSVNYETSKGDYTHALLKCPKDYQRSLNKDKSPNFIEVNVLDGKWFDAVEYYANQRHALKRYYDSLTEDRISKIRQKERQNA